MTLYRVGQNSPIGKISIRSLQEEGKASYGLSKSLKVDLVEGELIFPLGQKGLAELRGTPLLFGIIGVKRSTGKKFGPGFSTGEGGAIKGIFPLFYGGHIITRQVKDLRILAINGI